MFRKERCDLCGECLLRCHWIGAEPGQATEWMKAMIAGDRTPVLSRCLTCYACNEFCPKGANPFDLIAGLQELYRIFASEEAAGKEEEKYLFAGDLKGFPRTSRVMATCVFGRTEAHLLQGSFYDLPPRGRQAVLLLAALQPLGRREHSAKTCPRSCGSAGHDRRRRSGVFP